MTDPEERLRALAAPVVEAMRAFEDAVLALAPDRPVSPSPAYSPVAEARHRARRAAIIACARAQAAALRVGVEAMRLTREYVGEELLPNVDGWEHYELTKKLAAAEALVARLEAQK